METKISVIIPVCSAEDNIGECFSSLIAQTLKEIEIICIKDETTDEATELLYQFASEDQRIRVVRQEVQSIGEARSYGIRQAKGEYILFLEPQNVLAKDTLEIAYAEAEKNGAEVVFLAGKTFDEEITKAKQLPKCVQKKGFIQKEFFSAKKDKLLLSRFSMELWTKMFRKGFLEREGITELQYLDEEKYLSITALSIAKKLFVAGQAIIYLKKSKNSRSFTEKDLHNEFLFLYDVYDELNKRNVYPLVEEGFRNYTVLETAAVFRQITNYHLKEIFLKELFSERFEKIVSFEPIEESNEAAVIKEETTPKEEVVPKEISRAYDCLRGLKKGYLWKLRMDMLQRRKEFEVIINNTGGLHPKVSVIVPCYNIEQYVGECLDSLIHQTMEDIEIICINDGSTDRTIDILLEYAKQDARIIVVEQENSGLSIGRNVGVKNAVGEYICFVDSDDMLELSALKELYQQVKEKDLDILFYDGESFFETDDIKEKKSGYIDYYIRKADYSGYRNGKEFLCAMLENSEYRQSACMQMIRREYFLEKKLWFHPGILHEDNPFTFKGLLYSEHVGHVNKTYYLRRVKENSIMTSKKTFSHSYGYFASFLDMWELAQKTDLSEEQKDVIGHMLLQMIEVARGNFRATEDDEKYVFECLDPLERQLYIGFVVNAEKQLRQVRSLQKEKQSYNRQISRLKRELNKIKKARSYKIGQFFGKIKGKLKKLLHIA
ncbi:MAG: glycosyltransferase [Eubacterium sp.]|jgi:Glycosyltransferases involved in cell wall biogenesis|nr:glycosyltransferase [Eubacterium sp.]